jgi:hypothetical protein
VVEHEHPSCTFDVYRQVVLFSFFQAKIDKPYGSMALPEDINSVSTGIWTG